MFFQTYNVQHEPYNLDMRMFVPEGSYPGVRKASRKTKAKRRDRNRNARQARKRNR